MTNWNADFDSGMPMIVDIAMYGGPRAGKTSLLASMYSSVLGETRRAGLDIRRSNPDTIRQLDEAEDSLASLASQVANDPTLSSGEGVASTQSGEARRFDFIVQGSGVDVAALRFYDFAGEDIANMSKVVRDGVHTADILLVAINTPPMMEAHKNPDLSQLHLRMNVPDQLSELLNDWSGPAPSLVMLCPIKCERWLHDPELTGELNNAVHEMYRATLSILSRDAFADTTVVLAPVETVGAVSYDGYQLYDPSAPPSHRNIVMRWRSEKSAFWAPRFHEQPFRWAIFQVARGVDYAHVAQGEGGGAFQKLIAKFGHKWANEWGLPKIRVIEDFWLDQSGVETFRVAAHHLAAGRKLDEPYQLIKPGRLTEPLQR